jgi:hypothetical protein
VIHDAIRSLRQDEPVDRLTITNDGPGFLPPVIGAGVKKVRHRAGKNSYAAARLFGRTIPTVGVSMANSH